MSSVTLDLIQLHVMGALGALGGIVKDEAYDKGEMSGSIISRKTSIVQYSKWRLMKEPNDIWLIALGYLSRCGHRE